MNAAMRIYGATWGARDSLFGARKLAELNREKQNKKNAEGKNMSETKSIIPADNAVITYETDNGAVSLSKEIIKKYLVKEDTGITDQEIHLFLELCKYQRINPFLREAYLIKYRGSPAQMVCGKELFTKRAFKHDDFKGFNAGIVVVTKAGEMVEREGTIYAKNHGEELIGGWAEVRRKNYDVVFKSTAMLEEYKGTSPIWGKMPTTMIRKVALVQALREAFPDMYGGLYSQEEISTVDENDLPSDIVDLSEQPEPEKVYCCVECGAAFGAFELNGKSYSAKDAYDIAIERRKRPICKICHEKESNGLIPKETADYLYEQFDKDVNFAKKILSEFGYSRMQDVKQCDLSSILTRINEEKSKMANQSAEAETTPVTQGKDRINEVQSQLLFEGVDKNIAEKILSEFGYESASAILKKDIDAILKRLADEKLNGEKIDGVNQGESDTDLFGNELPWNKNGIPA